MNHKQPNKYAWAKKNALSGLGLVITGVILAFVGAPTIGGLVLLPGLAFLLGGFILILKLKFSKEHDKKNTSR